MISKASTVLALLPIAAYAATHDVQVGAGGLTFTPEAISANPGDEVIFHFMAGNHTASQSSLANPCGLEDGGFDSGFMFIANGTTDFPTFTVPVPDTKPIWVYCKQAAKTANSHCGKGMVFAVNCGADGAPNSFTNFKNAALAIGASLQANATSAGAPSSTDAAPAAASSDASSPATTPSSSSSSTGNVHVVTVGGNGTLQFNPPRVDAAPQDIISFQFMAKNHTATQSTFGAPCKKSQFSNSSLIGFDSGFMPVSDGSSPLIWNITVNDTTPIWVYCRQTTPVDHCGSGMVFAVNSNETTGSTKTFATFQAAAMAQNGTNATTSASGTSAPSASATGSSQRLTVSLVLMIGGLFVLFL